MHRKSEKTLVILKPDSVQRGLIGEIISRFERAGLKMIGVKLVVPTAAMAEKHYTTDPEWIMKTGRKAIEAYKKNGKKPPSEDPEEVGKKVLNNLKHYLTCGPVVVMAWRGIHAVGVVRKLVGSTEPMSSDVGTIRGDYTIDSYEIADLDGRAVRNLIHASGTEDEADKEINLWFKKDEILKYNLVSERILYDINLDGILE